MICFETIRQIKLQTRISKKRKGVITSFYELGESKIELLEASNPESPIAKFLDKGEAIHHIAFGVENIQDEIERLKKKDYFISERTERRC